MTPLTDWIEFKKGYFYRRVEEYAEVTYPVGSPFDLPKGLFVDTNKMPQNIEGASWTNRAGKREVKVPIAGWSLPTVACSERVYYAEGLGDSHGMAYGGKIVIPISGEYIYQLKGMPVAKSRFKAGDEINMPVTFLFMTKD